MVIHTISCKQCGDDTCTLGQQELCSRCIAEICCMAHTEDSFGRHRCNPLVSLKCRIENGVEKKYCAGHWKRRTQQCRYCHSKNVQVAYDDWLYCSKHMPDRVERDKLIHKMVCSDIANVIKDKLNEYAKSSKPILA